MARSKAIPGFKNDRVPPAQLVLTRPTELASKNGREWRIGCRLACWLLVIVASQANHTSQTVRAQTASLMTRTEPATDQAEAILPPSPSEGTTLQQCSWTHMPVTPPREIQKHDIVSVRVDLLSRMSADGKLSRKKDATYDAKLKDWIFFDSLRAIKPSPQSDGDPRVQGELRSKYRSEGDLETSESLAFNLAAEIVDIRPNGNLVLEGRAKIVLNDEHWSYLVRGTCRPESIGPNNVVLSRDMINLDIRKDETGSVAAGYQRGWFQKLFDIFQPF